MKGQFEQNIKQALEGFQADYNPADWTNLEKRLNKAKAGKSSGIGKALLIAASVIVTAGAIYYFSSTEKINNNIPVSNNTSDQEKNIVEKAEDNKLDQKTEITAVPQEDKTTESHNAEKERPAAVTTAPQQKNISPEKTETHVAENNEKAVPVKEQVQAPVEPSVSPSDLSASFRMEKNKVCEGAPIQFFADNNDVTCTYKWSFGDGEMSAEQNPKHVYAEAGTYAVKLRVVCAKDKKQTEQKGSIIVVAAPSVQFNYSAAEDNNLLINFEADADKVTAWKWEFGDKQTASVQNPSHTYGKKGSYKVTLIAENSTGCTAVVVKDLNLKIDLLPPTGFSPNGDGKNDTWMPYALKNGDFNFTLTITDKSGKVVFSTRDKNDEWDGQNTKVGDTFIWRAVIKEKNGEESSYQGLITVAE